MRRALSIALLTLGLSAPVMLPVPPVLAQVEASEATQILERLGYGAYAVHLEHLYRSPPDDPTMSPQQRANWTRAAQDLFSRDDILAAATAGMQAISPEQLEDLQRFYATDLAERVTALEVAVQDPDRAKEIEEAVEAFADDLAKMPAPRRKLIDDLESALGSLEDTVVQVMNFQIGLMQGMVDGNPAAVGMTQEEILLQIQSNADLIRAQIEEGAGRWAAYTYQSLSEDELAAYVDFLRTPAAQALYRLTDEAVLEVIERDAYRLGQLYALLESSEEL